VRSRFVREEQFSRRCAAASVTACYALCRQKQAGRPEGRPLIAAEWGAYVDSTDPLPLSSPCNSRAPISISAWPVEMA
jgi:hypothetical protein